MEIYKTIKLGPESINNRLIIKINGDDDKGKLKLFLLIIRKIWRFGKELSFFIITLYRLSNERIIDFLKFCK